MCHVSKRPRADDGVAVVVGTGVGEQCVDDAGGGVGDGDYDGGLPDLGPVDALAVQRGGDDFLPGAVASKPSAWGISSSKDRSLLVGDAVDRLTDHVGDGSRLGNHDHVGSLDLGDCRSGALGHGTDDVAACGLVAGGHDGP